MSTLTIVLLVILAALVAVLIFLYFWGKKLQKKQDESQAQMEASKQSKMPIVKARVQGKIMTLVSDQKVFPLIPVGKSVKATLSGIYIMDVKAIRGKLETPPPKKKWYQKIVPGKKS